MNNFVTCFWWYVALNVVAVVLVMLVQAPQLLLSMIAGYWLLFKVLGQGD